MNRHGVALSPLQVRVVKRVVEGAGNKELARELGIQLGAVKRMMGTIYATIGVSHRTQCVVWWLSGYVPGEEGEE